jgi:hypothetical protein
VVGGVGVYIKRLASRGGAGRGGARRERWRGGVREAPVNAAPALKSADRAALTAHLAVNADRTLESAARTALTRAFRASATATRPSLDARS